MVRPLPAPLPAPSNLDHPSRTGIEAGPDPGAAPPADGVGSTLETGTGDAGQAQVDPDPAEIPGRVVPDPEVPDPEAGARRNELS